MNDSISEAHVLRNTVENISGLACIALVEIPAILRLVIGRLEQGKDNNEDAILALRAACDKAVETVDTIDGEVVGVGCRESARIVS
ncbi:MAG: hypothetical protein ACYCXX_00610 [Acidiferrobacter thiooxydans]